MVDDKQLDKEGDGHQQGGIQVIVRMTKIMRALSSHPQGLSLAEIAADVGLPRSTVQRIINALLAENIVEPAGPQGGVRLGPALGQMIYQTQADIIPVVRPHIERLSQELQETVCLSRLNGYHISLLDMVIGEQVLRIVLPMGGVAPMHVTAEGKVLLARMSDSKVIEWLDRDLPQMTCHSKTREQLMQELAEVRKTGFGFDIEEHTEGICAIATSIGTYRGAYAITILAPTPRMHARVNQFKQALTEIRIVLERLLGTSVTKLPPHA